MDEKIKQLAQIKKEIKSLPTITSKTLDTKVANMRTKAREGYYPNDWNETILNTTAKEIQHTSIYKQCNTSGILKNP